MSRKDYHEGYTGIGRPNKVSKITEDQWIEIIRAIGNGVPYAFVCDLAGVGLSTWNAWIKQGKRDLGLDKTSAFTEFLYRVEAAKSAHVREAMAKMREADKGHKGEEWILSRRHPEQFHQGTKLEHSGKVDGDHTVTLFDAGVLADLEGVDDLEDDDD